MSEQFDFPSLKSGKSSNKSKLKKKEKETIIEKESPINLAINSIEEMKEKIEEKERFKIEKISSFYSFLILNKYVPKISDELNLVFQILSFDPNVHLEVVEENNYFLSNQTRNFVYFSFQMLSNLEQLISKMGTPFINKLVSIKV